MRPVIFNWWEVPVDPIREGGLSCKAELKRLWSRINNCSLIGGMSRVVYLDSPKEYWKRSHVQSQLRSRIVSARPFCLQQDVVFRERDWFKKGKDDLPIA
jgi:hypothetical protein